MMRSVFSVACAVLLFGTTPAYAYYEYNRTVYKLQTPHGSYYSYPLHNSYVPRVRYPTAQYIDVTPQYRYSYLPTYQPYNNYYNNSVYTPPTYHGSAGGTCLHYLQNGECAIEQWNPPRQNSRSYRYYDDDDDYYYDYDDDDYDDYDDD